MNELTLAVAGGGKTQSIVDACVAIAAPHRTLALTYTSTGQAELASRLRGRFGPQVPPLVIGWFAFLQRHFIRPYLPALFPQHRLRGFNFDGDPGRFATGAARYLDRSNRAYRLHISKLAWEVMRAAKNAPIDRLERMYETIFIDEVQDLVGWDLDILDALFSSKVSVRLVGDLRQSILETNPSDKRNKQFRGVAMLNWFERRRKAGLAIVHQTETHRCNQSIASFADQIFAHDTGFKPTKSTQTKTTEHDGVVCVSVDDVEQYVARYDPQCLRYSVVSAKSSPLNFRNFGEVKGLTFDRVLVWPTTSIQDYLAGKCSLTGRSACGLYVAVTRARYSVAIVVSPKVAQKTKLAMWTA